MKGRRALRELVLRRFAAMLRKLPGPAGEGMTLSPRRGGRRWPGMVLFPWVGSLKSGFEFPQVNMGVDGRRIHFFMTE